MRPCDGGWWDGRAARLPCARVAEHGYPRWVGAATYDEHLAAGNLASAGAAEAAGPVPFSRHLERVNREDRAHLARGAALGGERLGRGGWGRAGVAAGDAMGRGVAPGDVPRLGEVASLPPAVRTEQVRRAYVAERVLPRGMSMDVLA